MSMAAFASVARPSVTIEDYRNFHGMLCRPITARRCIDSFTGTILFMPTHYSTNTICRYDCSNGMLNLFSYYLLVLVSFTGLSTLFQQTKFLAAEKVPAYPHQLNVDKKLVSKRNPKLFVDKNVLDYIMHQTDSSTLQLVRRFEYYFGGLVPLSVIMLHFVCDKGFLHLVEVYEVERWRQVFSFVTDTLGEAVRWITGKQLKKEQ